MRVNQAGSKKSMKAGGAKAPKPTPAVQAISAEESLQIARERVQNAMPEIIQAFVEEAKQGSCQHAKFLMDFVAEEPEGEKEDEEPEGESLASILLKELRESEVVEQDAG